MTGVAQSHPLAAFIGIPWTPCGASMTGADCWGLVRMAAHALYGLDFPEYFYSAQDLIGDAAKIIEGEERRVGAGSAWHAVDMQPFAPGVVHIFRIKGMTTHCGLGLGGGEFLHSLAGHDSAIESLDTLQWRQRRTGTYRWTP